MYDDDSLSKMIRSYQLREVVALVLSGVAIFGAVDLLCLIAQAL